MRKVKTKASLCIRTVTPRSSTPAYILYNLHEEKVNGNFYFGYRLYWSDEGYIKRCAVDGTGIELVNINTTAIFMNPDLLLIYKVSPV